MIVNVLFQETYISCAKTIFVSSLPSKVLHKIFTKDYGDQHARL